MSYSSETAGGGESGGRTAPSDGDSGRQASALSCDLCFLARASLAEGVVGFPPLDLPKRVVHATMSSSLRTCASAWASSV